MLLKTIFQGDSLSIGFILNPEYDSSRLENIYAYLGNRALNPVLVDGIIRCELTSLNTKLFYGKQPLSLKIDDSTFGIRNIFVGEIIFSGCSGTADSSINEGYNLLIDIVIDETVSTANVVLFEAIKGLNAYEVWLISNPGKTQQDYFDFLREPATTASEEFAITESTRVEFENARKTAEEGRVSNETGRVTWYNSAVEWYNSAVEWYNNAKTTVSQALSDMANATGLINTATENANAATANANTSANLATSKATLADEKATLANTKAGLADTATTNANNAEGLRANAEAGRVTAETARGTQESGRVTAETGRVTWYNTAVTAIANALSSIITATNNAITATSQANTARDGANTAATAANTAAAIITPVIYNQSARTIAISAFNIQMSDANGLCLAEDFTKLTGMASPTTFTISNPLLKKPFRLILSGGILAVPTFTGYTVSWIAGSLVTDYVPAKTNYLICEIMSAGQMYCFLGAQV